MLVMRWIGPIRNNVWYGYLVLSVVGSRCQFLDCTGAVSSTHVYVIRESVERGEVEAQLFRGGSSINIT
jgi:hypothetical protein